MSTHTCPHGGAKFVREDDDSGMSVRCGQCGWLCDMCKADRADARTEKLADRLAAVERHVRSNKRIDWANDMHDALATRVAEIDKRLSTSVHDLDLWCEENIDRVNSRLEALEARLQQVEDDTNAKVSPDGPNPRLAERVEFLEARQQDEAGEGDLTEGPDDVLDLEAKVRKGMWCFTGLGLEGHDASIRHELVREIVDGMIRECEKADIFTRHVYYWTVWIKREFGGE